MKALKLVVMVLFFTMLVFGENLIPLPELNRPTSLYLNGDNLLISQFPEVLIYELKDFKLKAKFGKSGEGPQEFMRWLNAQFHPTDKSLITVSSNMKISTYTVDGKFVNESRMEKLLYRTELRPIGKNYILRGSTGEGEGNNMIFYRTLELYNPKFEKIMDITKWLSARQYGRVDPTDYDFYGGEFTIYNDKIFLLLRYKGNIEVYDADGKKLYSIDYPGYERLPVTEKDKEAFWEYFKTDPRHRDHIQQIRQEVVFPGFYGAARRLFVADDKIYVLTHKKINDNSEVILFDLTGKFLKKMMLPIRDQNPQEPNPTAVYKGKLYQLIEDIDAAQWDLVITEIKE